MNDFRHLLSGKTTMNNFRHLCRAAAMLGLAVAGPLCAQTTMPSDTWTWRATIYLWGPSINGTSNFKNLPGGGEIDTDVNTEGYLSRLQGAFMATLEARKGPWSMLGDAIYVNFGNHSSSIRSIGGPGGSVPVPVDSGTTTDLEGFVGTLAGGYSIFQRPGARADVIAGLRYAKIKSKLDWELSTSAGVVGTSGSAEATKSLTDGIVGARGSLDLSPQWFVPWYADVGAGSSRLTWQALAGIGYRFGWGDVVLAYRHLSYEFHDSRIAADVQFSGPALGVAFRF
jgi:hypothetical protein